MFLAKIGYVTKKHLINIVSVKMKDMAEKSNLVARLRKSSIGWVPGKLKP